MRVLLDYNPDTNVSVATSGLLQFSRSYSLIHGYLAIVVCICGTLANLANVIVLTRPKMTSSTNIILTWLAIADLLKMVAYLPFDVHFYVLCDPSLPFPSTLIKGWSVYLIFFINFSVVCHTATTWLTVTLAIFRCLCICLPIRGAKYCSLGRAKVAIFVVYASTILVCIPNYVATRTEVRFTRLHYI